MLLPLLFLREAWASSSADTVVLAPSGGGVTFRQRGNNEMKERERERERERDRQTDRQTDRRQTDRERERERQTQCAGKAL